MRRLLLSVLLTLLAVAGCTKGAETLSITGDQALLGKVVAAQEAKTSPPLKDLTDFEWDTVYAYYEAFGPAQINADIGQKVFNEDGLFLINETLLVFLKDGSPVRAITFLPLRFDVGRHSHDVVVDKGLNLVEPN